MKSEVIPEILTGLTSSRKTLPCKLFYDERGSLLFDRICELEEYYPTRTEQSILVEALPEIVNLVGSAAQLIEYGSGSSHKTRLLLRALRDLVAYLPIDISRDYLLDVAKGLKEEFTGLAIHPICADYTQSVEIPPTFGSQARRVFFFPGSTIGNFDRDEALFFLKRTANLAGENGALIIGVDLKKDRSVLEAAYNDRQGVTAAFNLNILSRVNRELGAHFDPSKFAHKAFYSEHRGRIEMHLESKYNHRVKVGSTEIEFKAQETIHTENSYKFTVEEFHALARRAGFLPIRTWTDEQKWFSVHFLERATARD